MRTAQDREIVISRTVAAPRDLVWKAWTAPEHLIKWWGPDGFTNTFHEIDVREKGVWRFTMHGPDGVDYPNRIVFTEILPPERISFLHDDDSEDSRERFASIVTFEEDGGKTAVTLRSIFETKERRDRAVEKYGAIEGGKQTLGRMADYVERTLSPTL